MRVRREGSLTAQVAFMRRSRRLVFEAMLVEMDLSPVENATLHYGLVRTSVGEVLALRPDRAAMGDAISAQEESPSGTVRTMATIERLLLR
jgi:hypothetical protein